MNRLTRAATVVVAAVTALSAVTWLVTVGDSAAADRTGPALVSTEEPPVFSATLSVIPDHPLIFPGEILTVTVDLAVSEGCQYPVFEMTLRQKDGEAVIFEPIAPPIGIITGPVPIPMVWTLRATQPGTATFDARTFGERYCGDFWNWHYLYGESEPVTVAAGPYSTRLPVIRR